MSHVFRKFLISYLAILMIPLISGIISYRTSIDIAETNSVESSLLVLNQTKDNLERRFAEIEQFAIQLAMNRRLTRQLMQRGDGEGSDVTALRELSHELLGYSHTNDFLESFYIYMNRSDIVLGPGSVFYRADHFYQLHQYRGVTPKQWRDMLNEVHHREIIPLQPYVRNGKEVSVITYIQSLPLNAYNQPQGTVIVTIDQSKIANMLRSISDRYGGWAYIRDRDGRMIAWTGIAPENAAAEQVEISGDTLLISTTSDRDGWTYTAGIPKAAVMHEAHAIRRTTAIVAVTTLFVGLAVCLLLAYRNSAPLHRLVAVIREQAGQDPLRNKSEYDFIHGNISELMTTNKKLQEEVDRQLPLLQDNFLKRLLRGEFPSAKEMEAMADQVGIKLGASIGYACVIRVNGYGGEDSKEILDELQAARLIIAQALPQLRLHRYHLTYWDADKIALLLMYEEEPDETELSRLERGFGTLRAAMETDYRMTISVAMGRLFRDWSDIGLSFDEARQALDGLSRKDGQAVLWYHMLPLESHTYYYPIDMELRLLKVLKSGESSEAKRLLSQIFGMNFAERLLASEMAQQLITELKGTLLKMFNQKTFRNVDKFSALKERILHVKWSEHVDEMQRELEEAIEAFCEAYQEEREESDHETIHQVIEVIEKIYMESDLNLYRVAEAVGRPEKVLSRLFKEKTNENLSDYIEKVRINKAVELLTNTKLTIDDIAGQTGYNSAHSFRRAFKRLTGLSPSLYRKPAE